MTPTELAAAINNAGSDEIADFNDNSDYTLHHSGGSGSSDGVGWASVHAGFDSEEKAQFAAALNLGVKDPC